jgi:ABC-type multidrug transport system fused ATPase/permease subunit
MNITNLLELYTGEYIKNNKLFLFGFILLTFIYYIIEVIGIGYVISQLSNKINKTFFIYFIVLGIIIVILTYIKGLFMAKAASDVTTFSRNKFFRALLNRYGTSYQDMNIGNTINRIFAVTLEYRFAVINFFNITLPAIFILLITSCVIFNINRYIGCLLFICLFFNIIITLKEYNNISQKKIEQEIHFYETFNSLTDQVNNLMNSYLNNETKNEQNKITDRQNSYKEKVFNSENSVNYINTYLMINLMVFLTLVIYFVYIDKIENKALFTVMLIYFVSNYISYSKELGILIPHIGITLGSYNYFKNLLTNNDNGKIDKINYGNINFKNITFSYKNNNPIINNLTLEIKHKTKIAIVGRSGSGKTTLTKLILKLYNNYQGNIYIDGININDIETNYLRKKVIYVNQRTHLLNRSVIENINYGNNIDIKIINNLLNKYSLTDIFSGLKDGVNEKCLVGGSNLSLGMQKVILLTRGILKSQNSLIMIFDEPLAGLDAKTRKKVINMIINECKNKTLIIITHDKEIIPYMDKTINLSEINKK